MSEDYCSQPMLMNFSTGDSQLTYLRARIPDKLFEKEKICITLDTISFTICIYSCIQGKCSRKALHVSFHLSACLRYSTARTRILQNIVIKSKTNVYG